MAPRGGLANPQLDLGYLVHCQLVGLFGDQAPKPFCLPIQLSTEPRTGDGQSLQVLGYSAQAGSVLQRRAQVGSTPQQWGALLEGRVDSKLLPSDWRKDEEFEFTTKVGKMQIRKKFKLKDMMYNGKLEM